MHTATERYQKLGAKEDTYAEASDNFQDFHSALKIMFDDCGFFIAL